MQVPQTWQELVKETRERLGITREEFAKLLGISLSALGHWEYNGVVPPPVYQNIVGQLWANHEAVRDQLGRNKAQYIHGIDAVRYTSEGSGGVGKQDNFWRGIVVGGIVVGVLALLVNSLKTPKSGGIE